MVDTLSVIHENWTLPGLKEKRESTLGHNADIVREIRDIDLGRRSDLLARSGYCLTCSAFISISDEHTAALPDDLRSDFNADYAFSAHLMDEIPVLWIAFGPLSPIDADARERRSALDRLTVVRLFPTNEGLFAKLAAESVSIHRFLSPEQINPDQLRRWLLCCERTHGDRCRPGKAAFAIQAKVQPSFIDVENECIVTPDSEVPYVALSYVWGPVETLQAKKENIEILRHPGSLSASSAQAVLLTIRDAMKLCALIGQRYLWVDRVCIIQDDLESKWQHLHAMADTYAKAQFTIVAADGTHADQGLSGVSRCSDERRKHLVPLPTRTMIRPRTKVNEKDRFAGSIWSTRAWTFQEHVFSRRLLYMDESISWICFSAIWEETKSLPPDMQAEGVAGSDHYASGGKLFAIGWPSLTEYARLVEQYNVRSLTYDSDVLSAFLGVMTQMCYGFPAGFYGGLPEFYFTVCLLWQPGGGLRPRSAQAGCAPSWSWLGWSGKLDLAMWTCNTDTELPHTEFETKITPLVKFFKTQDRTNVTASCIDDTFHVVRTHFTVNAGATPDHWQKHDGDPESRFEPYYTYEGYNGQPSHIGIHRRFRFPVPPFQRPRDLNPIPTEEQNLYFSTQRAYLGIGELADDSSWRNEGHKNGDYYAVDVPLFLASGEWAGSLRINTKDTHDIPVGERIEVIRIAKGSVPTRGHSEGHQGDKTSTRSTEGPTCHPFEDCVRRQELHAYARYDFYFVLWVGRREGVAWRKALGTVWECVWDLADPVDVDIVLI